MERKVWTILLITFIIYSPLTYFFCDSKSCQKYPDRHILSGWTVWQNKNCQTCHQLYGLGGYLGPDLTNIAAHPEKGDKYMAVFIKYGTSRMPDFHLNDSEVNDVICFLKWVNTSGKSKVPPGNIHWTGTYTLDN